MLFGSWNGSILGATVFIGGRHILKNPDCIKFLSICDVRKSFDGNIAIIYGVIEVPVHTVQPESIGRRCVCRRKSGPKVCVVFVRVCVSIGDRFREV